MYAIEHSIDSTVLARLHGACFDNAWDARTFDTLLKDTHTHALVAIQKGTPVGFTVYRIAADEAEILTLGVLPSQRKKGAGHALVTAICTQLAAQHIHHCFLEMATHNVAALALYQRAGFVLAGTRQNYYAAKDGNRQDAAILRCDLLQHYGETL